MQILLCVAFIFFFCQENATFQEFYFRRVSKEENSIFQVVCFTWQDRTKANVGYFRKIEAFSTYWILGFMLDVVGDTDE